MRRFASSSPRETERIAGELARDLAPGDLVTVTGELGAGKTTFVRGACRALGVRGPVTSPTYALAQRYDGRVAVSHLDLYRLETLAESDWADLEPYFDGAVAFVEWPERAAALLPAPRRHVRLHVLDPDRRLIEVEEEGKTLQNGLFLRC